LVAKLEACSSGGFVVVVETSIKSVLELIIPITRGWDLIKLILKDYRRGAQIAARKNALPKKLLM